MPPPYGCVKKNCHCEPVRTLVWQSLCPSGLLRSAGLISMALAVAVYGLVLLGYALVTGSLLYPNIPATQAVIALLSAIYMACARRGINRALKKA